MVELSGSRALAGLFLNLKYKGHLSLFFVFVNIVHSGKTGYNVALLLRVIHGLFYKSQVTLC